MDALLMAEVHPRKRGALKAKIKEVIREERRKYRGQSLLVVELAEALRETPLVGKEGLLNRVTAFLQIERREAGLPRIERSRENA